MLVGYVGSPIYVSYSCDVVTCAVHCFVVARRRNETYCGFPSRAAKWPDLNNELYLHCILVIDMGVGTRSVEGWMILICTFKICCMNI
jgi:hypothetical protein